MEAFDGVLFSDLVGRVVRCAIACGLNSTDFVVHAPRHRGIAFLEHAKHLCKKFFDAFLPRRAFDRQALPEITQQKLDDNSVVDTGGLRGAADIFKRRGKIDAQQLQTSGEGVETRFYLGDLPHGIPLCNIIYYSTICPRRKPRLLAIWASRRPFEPSISPLQASEVSRCIAGVCFIPYERFDEDCKESVRKANRCE